MVTEEQVPDPNGLCLSPDYKKLYVISTGKGPGDTRPGGKGDISVFDVGSDNKLSNQKLFTDCVIDGVKCGPDRMRVRCRRQPLGVQQRGAGCGLQWRDGVESCRQAHRPYPHPRGRREHLLRGSEAQPVVHGRKPVALCAIHRDAGGGLPAEPNRVRSGQPKSPTGGRRYYTSTAVHSPRAGSLARGGMADGPSQTW